MNRTGKRPARWREVREAILLYTFVAIGASIGGTARALVSMITIEVTGPGFPWGTLVANVAGSFAIGFFATLTGPDGRLLLSTRVRQFVMTGICGGFTTFSMFSLETFRLATAGNYLMATLNIGVSVVAWLVAVWIGQALAAQFNRLGGM
jgi:CrcB protein